MLLALRGLLIFEKPQRQKFSIADLIDLTVE